METTPVEYGCVKCGKQTSVAKCVGCLKSFCHNDYGHHRQDLRKILDEIETNCGLLQQSITEQTEALDKHTLIQQIDQWEQNSIDKIKETAEKTRKLFLDYTFRYMSEIEEKLEALKDRLKQSREENDFMETKLNRWNKQLTLLKEEIKMPSSLKLRYDLPPITDKIYADLPPSLWIQNINISVMLVPNGITIAGGYGQGNELDRLCYPWNIYVDDDQNVYVADCSNHRIVLWKKDATSGQVVAGGNGQGNGDNQLNKPAGMIIDKENDCFIICDFGNQRVVRQSRQDGTSGETIISNINCCDIKMDNDGYLYVCDYKNHEVRRWKIGDTNGTVVAGGNGKGNRLDQLDAPFHIFVDQDHSVFVSDYNNHRVMKWMKDAKEGIIVAGGQGKGHGLTQLSGPRGVIVDQLGFVYVAEWGNHRVTRWLKGATQGSIVVGGNGEGGRAYQFRGPVNLSFDQNNLYVLDNGNHRVQQFCIDTS